MSNYRLRNSIYNASHHSDLECYCNLMSSKHVISGAESIMHLTRKHKSLLSRRLESHIKALKQKKFDLPVRA